MSGLRVGLMGGTPPMLGGAGLESQVERTGAALRRVGHEPVIVASADADERIDILHVFGSEPASWHHLRHWTRNRVPLVVTSIVVVSPGLPEILLRASARVPGLMTSGRMRAGLLRRADAVIAGTAYEAGLVRKLGARAETIEVVANGADRVEPAPLAEGLPDSYVLMVGSISPRKRQAEVAAALAGSPQQVVLAGAYTGPEEQRAETELQLAESGATLLGHVEDPAALAALERGAEAVVHLSDAEVQSLAVLEALSQGTPVLASDIPSHRELAAANPGWVRLVENPGDLTAALAEQAREGTPTRPPEIPTWDEVAVKLSAIYNRLLR